MSFHDFFSTRWLLSRKFKTDRIFSVARWFWVKIPKIGHKPPDFITRFFLKKWKIPRFWAKIPSIFCVWNKVKLVYFSFVYHISFEINSTWQLLVAFWLLFTIFLLLWLLLVNLRCEFQKLKRRDKLMNLFANPPDPVLAIQDILKAVSVKAVSFRCFDDADVVFNNVPSLALALIRFKNRLSCY